MKFEPVAQRSSARNKTHFARSPEYKQVRADVFTYVLLDWERPRNMCFSHSHNEGALLQ
jgi:hypothetical protein